MTRAEMHNIKREAEKTNSRWVEGYCMYYSDLPDGITKYSMIRLGCNSGVLGWNWTLYYCKENYTFYVDGYRNF